MNILQFNDDCMELILSDCIMLRIVTSQTNRYFYDRLNVKTGILREFIVLYDKLYLKRDARLATYLYSGFDRGFDREFGKGFNRGSFDRPCDGSIISYIRSIFVPYGLPNIDDLMSVFNSSRNTNIIGRAIVNYLIVNGSDHDFRLPFMMKYEFTASELSLMFSANNILCCAIMSEMKRQNIKNPIKDLMMDLIFRPSYIQPILMYCSSLFDNMVKHIDFCGITRDVMSLYPYITTLSIFVGNADNLDTKYFLFGCEYAQRNGCLTVFNKKCRHLCYLRIHYLQPIDLCDSIRKFVIGFPSNGRQR